MNAPRQAILVWPLRESKDRRTEVPLLPEEGGLILGWKSSSDDKDHSTCCVVAGILTWEIHMLERFEEWKKTTSDPMCTCFKCRIEVLGVWINERQVPIGQQANLTRVQKLPRFFNNKQGPWMEENDSNFAIQERQQQQQQQQLILYRPVDGFNHYRHASSWRRSNFSEGLLRQLSEAKYIMENIQRDLANLSEVPQETESSRLSVPCRTSAAVPKQVATQHHTRRKDVTEDETFRENLFKRILASAKRRSLFLLHWKRFSYCVTSSLEIYLLQFPALELLQLLTKRNHVCRKDHSSSNRQDDAYNYITWYNQVMAVLANVTLGLAVGGLLWYRETDVLAWLEQAWRVGHDDALSSGIAWLETFPAGFKLNVPLTQNMGREITMLVQLYGSVSSSLWSVLPKVWVFRGLSLLAMLWGFTSFVAILFDLLSLATMHIAIVATCFRAMHRAQLYLLASLWRLFRGKKRNILRHRNDSMEYDSMQLLLGMILFTAILFLFTTILVYYSFFAVLDFAIHVGAILLFVGYAFVRFLPLGKCTLRVWHPGWFTERVFLEETNDESGDGERIVTRL